MFIEHTQLEPKLVVYIKKNHCEHNVSYHAAAAAAALLLCLRRPLRRLLLRQPPAFSDYLGLLRGVLLQLPLPLLDLRVQGR